jgi:hypothetical protein
MNMGQKKVARTTEWRRQQFQKNIKDHCENLRKEYIKQQAQNSEQDTYFGENKNGSKEKT